MKSKSLRKRLLRAEQLEARRVLATLQVLNTNDDGAGSLRQAIFDANSTPAHDEIQFAISGSAGTHAIALQSPLPKLANPITIDGKSQPGYSDSPLIEITNGSSDSFVGFELQSGASNSTIRGLSITGFAVGIKDLSSGGSLFEDNYLGVKPDGHTADGNGTGIDIFGTLGSALSSRAIVANSLISANRFGGVIISNSEAVHVLANSIGTDRSGISAIPNGVGVEIRSSSNILLGGDAQRGQGNLISGNTIYGVTVSGHDPASQLPVHVAGNWIGTTSNGGSSLANNLGIYLNSARNVRVGVHNGVGEANVISGNTSTGINLRGSATTNNVIAGNLVGLTPDGLSAMPNGIWGVSITGGAHHNYIGTDGDGINDEIEGNTISANGRHQIEIKNAGTDGNVVAGNVIGLSTDESTLLTTGTPILAHFDAQGTRIGTDGNGVSDGLEGNRIATDGTYGVLLQFRADNTIVAGNHIGWLRPNGTGGALYGIDIRDSDNVRVGSNFDGVSDDAEGNRITDSRLIGVIVRDSASVTIRRNSISQSGFGSIQLDGSPTHPNDSGDLDTGANGLLNHPVISFVSDAEQTEIIGFYNGSPNEPISLDFYSSLSPSPETRETATWIYSFSETTDASGNFDFRFTLPYELDSRAYVTGTATDGSGNTSVVSSGKRAETQFTTVTMPFDGLLSMAVYRPNGEFVRTLHEATPVSAGEIPVGWDGLDEYGNIMAGGDYTWKAIFSQAVAVDDGQVGEGAEIAYGIHEHSNAVSAIAIDSNDAVYESSFFEEASIDLRKWDSDGNPVWAKNISGGAGLAVDGDFVYVAQIFNGESRIERFSSADGTATPWDALPNGRLSVHNAAGNTQNAVPGISVDATHLWVSNRIDGEILVYNKVTGALLANFAISEPRGLAATGDGNVWVAHSGATVSLFDIAGTALIQQSGLDDPYAVTLGPGSPDATAQHLYVAEVGSGKVLEFSWDLSASSTSAVRSLFGAASPGPIHPDRFYWPTLGNAAIAVDSNGNIVAADAGNRRVMTFDSAGNVIRERRSEFQPTPFVDPDVNPNLLLSHRLQYEVDYSTGEWTATHNWRPADDLYSSDMSIIRELSNGKRYLFSNSVRSAVPGEKIVSVIYELSDTDMRRSAMIGADASELWIWTDTDGDGEVEESEKQSYAGIGDATDFQLLAPGVWVDQLGTVFIASWTEFLSGVGSTSSTRKLEIQGFDSQNNPLFDWSKLEIAVPVDETSSLFRTNNLRVSDATSEIFLVGTTAENRETGHFWMGGTAVDRRAADGSRILMLPIGGPSGQTEYVGSSNRIVAVATENTGEFFYTGHSEFDQHWVRMYTVDGLLVTTGFIGEHHGSHGGWIDHGMGIDAFTHPVTGTQYVYAEEVYYGKNIRYRIDNLETLTRAEATFEWVATPFEVTNTNDSGEGSLRQAMINANFNEGLNTITFALPGIPGESHSIQLSSPLPEITDPIIIDATSQVGYAGAPLVEIDGQNMGSAGLFLKPGSEGSTVQGLSLTNFGNAFQDRSGGGNLVQLNYFGLRPDGVSPAGNGVGVTIQYSPENAQKTQVRDNVIANSRGPGIGISEASNIHVFANYLGTDASGSTPQPNAYGVIVSNSNAILIGGDASQGEGNLISGNSTWGVSLNGISNPEQPVRVSGNWIGTTIDGLSPLPNGVGVDLNAASGFHLGVQSSPNERNLISGNNNQGISVRSGSTANQISGNFIGTDATGNVALPNGFDGISVNASPGNVIGTDGNGVEDANEGNVIGGNSRSQIAIGGQGANGNVVAGNRIGLGLDNVTLLNGTILVANGASGSQIGTDGNGVSDHLEGNLIGGLGVFGIVNELNAPNTVIAGNTIGYPREDGLGGTVVGIAVRDSDNVRIGSNRDGVSDALEANTVAFQRQLALQIRGDSTGVSVVQNQFLNNQGIGVDLADDGRTPNDDLDVDQGANGLQNFPIINSATGSSNASSVAGELTSAPNESYTLHFYVNAVATLGVTNEFLGAWPVTTDATGYANFEAVLPPGISGGDFITATATAADGSTSELADPFEVPPNQPPQINSQQFAVEENQAIVGLVDASDPDLPEDALTFSIAATGPDDGLFEITPGGVLSFKSSPDFEDPLDTGGAAGDNTYLVHISVQDSVGAHRSAEMAVSVSNVTATISGTVFVDANQDGLFDGGSESALDQVLIELLDENGGFLAEDTTSMGGAYAFEVDDEFATFRLREIQPEGVDDGQAVVGDANGNGITGETADGSVISTNEMLLQLGGQNASDYDFADYGQGVESGDTAGIGFWQNRRGQRLIRLGGDSLVAWLNTNFGNIFGSTFADGVGGDDAQEVARFYKREFFRKKMRGTSKVDAQFMALAFSTYFTSSDLAGHEHAARFGFNVSERGIGTKVVNVGANGAAFGVENYMDATIISLLLATNELTGADSDDDDSEDYSHVYDLNGDGILDDYERSLRAMANALYSSINERGS